MDGTKPNREPAKVELWNINATSYSVVRWSSALLLFTFPPTLLLFLFIPFCFPSFIRALNIFHRAQLSFLPYRITRRHTEQREYPRASRYTSSRSSARRNEFVNRSGSGKGGGGKWMFLMFWECNWSKNLFFNNSLIIYILIKDCTCDSIHKFFYFCEAELERYYFKWKSINLK